MNLVPIDANLLAADGADCCCWLDPAAVGAAWVCRIPDCVGGKFSFVPALRGGTVAWGAWGAGTARGGAGTGAGAVWAAGSPSICAVTRCCCAWSSKATEVPHISLNPPSPNISHLGRTLPPAQQKGKRKEKWKAYCRRPGTPTSHSRPAKSRIRFSWHWKIGHRGMCIPIKYHKLNISRVSVSQSVPRDTCCPKVMNVSDDSRNKCVCVCVYDTRRKELHTPCFAVSSSARRNWSSTNTRTFMSSWVPPTTHYFNEQDRWKCGLSCRLGWPVSPNCSRHAISLPGKLATRHRASQYHLIMPLKPGLRLLSSRLQPIFKRPSDLESAILSLFRDIPEHN